MGDVPELKQATIIQSTFVLPSERAFGNMN